MSHRPFTTMPVKVRGGRHRKPRPKTFKTEEEAKKWAESNDMKAFSVEPVGLGKKFRVVSTSQ